MEYLYSDLEKPVCLAYINEYLPLSAMTNKNMTDISWHPLENWLKVWFDVALDVEDKMILDSLVAASLGKYQIKKSREAIMSEILTLATPDPAQVMRLLDALDGYPSMAIALDNWNYPLARMRVEKVYTDGAITIEDRDLVLGTIPESAYEDTL